MERDEWSNTKHVCLKHSTSGLERVVEWHQAVGQGKCKGREDSTYQRCLFNSLGPLSLVFLDFHFMVVA